MIHMQRPIILQVSVLKLKLRGEEESKKRPRRKPSGRREFGLPYKASKTRCGSMSVGQHGKRLS
jgi:hypothetical protein